MAELIREIPPPAWNEHDPSFRLFMEAAARSPEDIQRRFGVGAHFAGHLLREWRVLGDNISYAVSRTDIRRLEHQYNRALLESNVGAQSVRSALLL